MSYCLNPHCQNREPPADVPAGTDLAGGGRTAMEFCPACQTPLLIQGRYLILHPLCQRPQAATEIFAVVDLQAPHLPLVLKTLTRPDAKLRTLFQREQALLMQLHHPGIPKGHDAFSMTLSNAQDLDCLVMERIIGENLEEWLQRHGHINQTQAIEWLQQLLQILDYIHQHNFFHRDIKPSNIMCRQDGQIVLIDFGSIRQVTETVVNNHTITTVVSFGYTAPEQIAGKAVLQSDFYALGQTFLHLLGATPGNPLEISPDLAKLLRQMTAETVRERPKTAKQILRTLSRIATAQKRQWRRWMGLSFVTGLVCGGLAMIPITRRIDWVVERDRYFPQPACDQTLQDQISCGEESLLSEQGAEAFFGGPAAGVANLKSEGIALVRQRQWSAAIAKFQQVWQRTKDPEALIYMNNAKIAATPSLQARTATIAVVVPVGSDVGISAMTNGMHLLRGVAQAQTQALEQQLGLRVVLVDDLNDPQIAQQQAKALARRQEILGVIGHPVSDTSLAALPIYEAYGLVLIAASSTSEELSTYTLKRDSIFFRTVPSNRINAAVMANLLLKLNPVPKVAVFYNPDKSYSRSLAGAFKETFQLLAGQIVDDPQGLFALSCSGTTCQRPSFDLVQALRFANAQRAEVFVVLPDANESQSNAWNEAIEIIQTRPTQWILMGDTMSRESKLLQPAAVARTVVSAAWDPLAQPDAPLVKFWQPPAQVTLQPVSWRTYTAYNAAKVFITAIQQRQGQGLNREQIRQQIAAPNFVAPGATGAVRFREGTGELQRPQIVLTQVCQQGNQIQFQPLLLPMQTPAARPGFCFQP